MSSSDIAFSYHFATDYEFVRLLANALVAKHVPAWYLDKLTKPIDVKNEQYLSGEINWQNEPQNWHATFLDHLCRAAGIVIVLSEAAAESRRSVGRGMWRERAAVEFFLADNPLRVREIVRSSGSPSDGLVQELASWGQRVLALGPVLRIVVSDPNAFNESTGVDRGMPLQLPEMKSMPTEWYELVRRDLYDVQWHCRRCGLQSDTYIMAHEIPPPVCPRCGFESMPYDANFPDQAEQSQSAPDLSERDQEFLAKVPDLLGKITAGYTNLKERLKKQEERLGSE